MTSYGKLLSKQGWAKCVTQCAHGFEPIVIHSRIGFDFDCDDLAIPGLEDEIDFFASQRTQVINAWWVAGKPGLNPYLEDCLFLSIHTHNT